MPCLATSTRYDRATGYFTSGILPLLVRGLEPFARAVGRIRLVASPNLTADDIEQINQGYADRDVVVAQRSADAIDALADADPIAFSQLSWLIAHGVLDIRFALLREQLSRGIYHEKFGVFYDDVDSVAFTGSLNETFAAIVGNFEYVDVFCSWSDRARVAEKADYFERLWNGETPRLQVLQFPAASRAKLLKAVPTDYPADKPFSLLADADVRQLRPHQVAALDAWKQNGKRGLLEMATGTGKTFTALSEISEMLTTGAVRAVIILAPYIAIAEQWRAETERITGSSPIVCHSQSGDWKARLKTEIALAAFQEDQPVLIVALYDTAQSDDFYELAQRLPEPVVVVADEVHNVTLESADRLLLERYTFRLGLSATPERYLDELGTERIQSYFDRIVFRYTLGDAIRAGVLTPYDYHPIICGPSDSIGQSRRLTGVNAAKLNKFFQTFTTTSSHVDGYGLVYCQPVQLDEAKEWLGVTLGLQIHTFTAQEDLEQRKQILKDFGSGFYKLLVAMRCLDEGVDVPPTRSAFLLGSSENPKQFVQRRGRVLRQYPGKTSADIYDFVYLPKPENKSHEDALRKELTRFAEFALSAKNADKAFNILLEAALARGIPLKEYIQQGV